MTQVKYIDVEKIFKEKNPAAYKWIPNFLINYIKKIVHEDDLNRYENANHHKLEFDYLDAALLEVKANVTYSGLENIPLTGGCIIASNHPLGGIDGMALIQIVGKVRKDVRFLVNDILKKLVNFGDLFVPVNKIGANAAENLRRIDAIYASEMATIIFPAGLVSRKIDGVIQDLAWNRSFIKKAVQYKKPVIPVVIEGQLSKFFYRLSSFRKKLGIKANIEMLYLANEMYKQQNSKTHITIGKPISYTVFDKSKKPDEWAACFRAYIYAMAKDINLDFQTFSKTFQYQKPLTN